MNRADHYWIKSEREKVKLEIIIDQVRELHKSYEWDNNVECVICSGTEYPCETIKALNGENNE